MPGTFERRDKALTTLFKGPIVGIAVKHEFRKTTREKMIGHQFGSVRVVLKHAREFELRTSEAEIHRRLARLRDEFRQIIAARKPRQDAVTLPAPGNHPTASQIGDQTPIMLESITFHAAMQPVIIPSGGDQNALSLFGHCGNRRSAVHIFQPKSIVVIFTSLFK